jgi:hypothetical protein
MTTKTLTGSYVSGYYLKPTYGDLIVDGDAYVGGAGISTSASQPAVILNLGNVSGSQNGISLSDGGMLTNGSAAYPHATISGGNSATSGGVIQITGGAGIIVNNATIGVSSWRRTFSDYYGHPAGTYTYENPSIRSSELLSLTNGSTNNRYATILSSVDAPQGIILNFGTIESATTIKLGYNVYFSTLSKTNDYSTNMVGGGLINGNLSDTNASITDGIYFGVVTSSVYNYGYVGRRLITHLNKCTAARQSRRLLATQLFWQVAAL